MAIAADLIITNAHVLTMDTENPHAEALAVRGNRISFVGTPEGAELIRGPQTRMVDAGGATLLPGMIDSHYHLLLGSLRLADIQLDEANDLHQVAELVRAYAARHPDSDWLVGYGLRYGLAAGGRELTRLDLDLLVHDRPLLLIAFDGHTAFANTRALELGGAMQGYDCGPNSEIVIGADGIPSGELREPGAFGRLRALAPKPDMARRRALLRQGVAQATRQGITSIHNMDGNLERLGIYQDAEQAGELALRVYVPFDITPATTPDQIAEALAMRSAATGRLVRAGAVKFFMDGVVEGYTGLILGSYAGEPQRSGEANFGIEQFNELVTEADRHGLQIFVHAVGDLAVRRTLDGFAEAQRSNGRRDSRHRVEHIELIHADDLPRFVELGAIASMQPYHAPIPPDYGSVWCERVGVARWERSFAWRSVLDTGAHMAFGSDWPVVSQSPWVGLAAAVNRNPWQPGMRPQAVTLSEALAAYTTGAAYAEFEERRKGMLRVGMLADLALLDRNIQELPASELGNIQVAMTVCDGTIVFEG